MGKHLILVGGGHAHMMVLRGLDQYVACGHRVTLISPSPYHYYSGMGPGLLSGIYRPQEVRFHIRKMAEDRGTTYVEDSVMLIDAARRTLRLTSGKTLSYDVASFNIGSTVPMDGLAERPADNVFPVKPIAALRQARQTIVRRLLSGPVKLMVIGGGAAGVEMAGNAWRLARDGGGTAEIVLVSRGGLLTGTPEKVQRLALASLRRRGIGVIEGQAVQRLAGGEAHLEDGRVLPYDFAFVAVGIRPSNLFQASGMRTAADGSLLVNRYLQSVDHPEIFGGGDCITPEDGRLDRVGVYAVRQNPVLLHNLMAALEGSALRAFDPGGPYLLIMNLGDGRGILWKNGRVWDGHTAFWLKDYIDRRFMRRFQVSGELNEPREAD